MVPTPTLSSGRLRVGVIGTAFHSTVHITRSQAATTLVSRRLENAERVAAAAGIGWFLDDYRAMLSEVDLDVVSIAVPGGLHCEMVFAAATRGC